MNGGIGRKKPKIAGKMWHRNEPPGLPESQRASGAGAYGRRPRISRRGDREPPDPKKGQGSISPGRGSLEKIIARWVNTPGDYLDDVVNILIFFFMATPIAEPHPQLIFPGYRSDDTNIKIKNIFHLRRTSPAREACRRGVNHEGVVGENLAIFEPDGAQGALLQGGYPPSLADSL